MEKMILYWIMQFKVYLCLVFMFQLVTLLSSNSFSILYLLLMLNIKMKHRSVNFILILQFEFDLYSYSENLIMVQINTYCISQFYHLFKYFCNKKTFFFKFPRVNFIFHLIKYIMLLFLFRFLIVSSIIHFFIL